MLHEQGPCLLEDPRINRREVRVQASCPTRPRARRGMSEADAALDRALDLMYDRALAELRAERGQRRG